MNTRRVERALPDGTRMRLVVATVAPGRGRVVEAHRKRRREERFTRARHLEMEDTWERLGIDPPEEHA